MTASPGAWPNAGAWPAEELVPVPACPLCSSENRKLLHADLQDKVGQAPGTWNLFQCALCHTAWLDPRPSASSLPAAYSDYFTHEAGGARVLVRKKGIVRKCLHEAANAYLFERYGLNRGEGRCGWLMWMVPPLRFAADSMCRHLPMPPRGGGRLLDVGCGNGGFLQIAQEMGWSAEGVDFDPEAVARARTQGLKVAVGELEAVDQREGAFDVITSSHVLEHVCEPARHVAHIYRLLKPGGMLWLQTPNIRSLGSRFYGRDWRGLEPPRHLALFDHAGIHRLLVGAGFTGIQDLPEALVSFDVMRASMAIREGRECRGAGQDKRRLASEALVEFVELILPRYREFITVRAIKR